MTSVNCEPTLNVGPKIVLRWCLGNGSGHTLHPFSAILFVYHLRHKTRGKL